MTQEAEGSSGGATEKRRGGGLAALAFLLALAGLGLGGWSAWELRRQALAGEAFVSRSAALHAELRQEADAAIERLAGTATEWKERVEALAGIREEFAGQLEEAKASIGARNRRWLLAEAGHLAALASQQALMARDKAAALQLLEMADRTLAEWQGLASHPLREALAQDMAALRAAPEVDVQGVYLGLAAVIGQVGELRAARPRLAGPPTGEPAGAALAEPTPRSLTGRGRGGSDVSDVEEGGFFAGLRRLAGLVGSRLARLVDFRHGRLEVKPILPPAEEAYLRQNLILKLQMAQLGLLAGDQAVYRQSLDLAMDWLGEGFDGEDPLTASLLDSLAGYAGRQVGVPLPDISGSLEQAREALRQYDAREPQE